MGGLKVALVRQVGSDHHHQNRNDWRTWTREQREARAEVMETRDWRGYDKNQKGSVGGRRCSEEGAELEIRLP